MTKPFLGYPYLTSRAHHLIFAGIKTYFFLLVRFKLTASTLFNYVQQYLWALFLELLLGNIGPSVVDYLFDYLDNEKLSHFVFLFSDSVCIYYQAG